MLSLVHLIARIFQKRGIKLQDSRIIIYEEYLVPDGDRSLGFCLHDLEFGFRGLGFCLRDPGLGLHDLGLFFHDIDRFGNSTTHPVCEQV